jgi:tripartite-type tricarboxylate transporter receptor subunit TctC
VVNRLNADLTAVLRTPDMQRRLRELGAEPDTASPQAYGRYVRAEADKWASVVHTAGIGQ